MTLQDLGNIGDLIAGIGAVGVVMVAWLQLNNLNKGLKANNLLTIFEIEFELNRRKERLAEIRNEIEIYLQELKNKQNTTEEEKALVKVKDGHRKEAYENYLNVFDRLCGHILNGKLDENDFRLEYREMLFDTIENDKERMFETGSKFRNMVKLFHKWKDK